MAFDFLRVTQILSSRATFNLNLVHLKEKKKTVLNLPVSLLKRAPSLLYVVTVLFAMRQTVISHM